MSRTRGQDAYTKGDPPIVRALRYATEPPPLPWRSFGAAVFIQASALALGTFLALHTPDRLAEAPRKSRFSTLFIPRRINPPEKAPPPAQINKPHLAARAPRPKL